MFGDWLLCDFHIHTKMSDGDLSVDEIVDLYGKKGFDAIAITDHILDAHNLEIYRNQLGQAPAIEKSGFEDYLDVLWQAAKKAWQNYEMLLIPGFEITNDVHKFHLLGIDMKKYIDPDLSVEAIIAQIHQQGGVAIACHPHQRGPNGDMYSKFLWDNNERFEPLFDAWEVGNRDDLFNVVGLKKFNYVANSDFHQLQHFYSWKTLLRCEKNTEAIKDAIRKNTGVSIYLMRKEKTE
jgi:predicted metal-dependent phosphoesterase TrpH